MIALKMAAIAPNVAPRTTTIAPNRGRIICGIPKSVGASDSNRFTTWRLAIAMFQKAVSRRKLTLDGSAKPGAMVRNTAFNNKGSAANVAAVSHTIAWKTKASRVSRSGCWNSNIIVPPSSLPSRYRNAYALPMYPRTWPDIDKVNAAVASAYGAATVALGAAFVDAWPGEALLLPPLGAGLSICLIHLGLLMAAYWVRVMVGAFSMRLVDSAPFRLGYFAFLLISIVMFGVYAVLGAAIVLKLAFPAAAAAPTKK